MVLLTHAILVVLSWLGVWPDLTADPLRPNLPGLTGRPDFHNEVGEIMWRSLLRCGRFNTVDARLMQLRAKGVNGAEYQRAVDSARREMNELMEEEYRDFERMMRAAEKFERWKQERRSDNPPRPLPDRVPAKPIG